MIFIGYTLLVGYSTSVTYIKRVQILKLIYKIAHTTPTVIFTKLNQKFSEHKTTIKYQCPAYPVQTMFIITTQLS